MATVLKPLAKIKLAINAHRLLGEKWPASGWVLACESWPDIAEKWAGCDDATGAMDEFVRRATAGAVEVVADVPKAETR